MIPLTKLKALPSDFSPTTFVVINFDWLEGWLETARYTRSQKVPLQTVQTTIDVRYSGGFGGFMDNLVLAESPDMVKGLSEWDRDLLFHKRQVINALIFSLKGKKVPRLQYNRFPVIAGFYQLTGRLPTKKDSPIIQYSELYKPIWVGPYESIKLRSRIRIKVTRGS